MLPALDRHPDGLFWSAPHAIDSDFTIEDPLALDYLAQQVGLWLFEGFTTRTSRAQNYAVVLYGLHLADLAIARFGARADDETRTRLFERWERFWALATLEHRKGDLERSDPDAMRGIRGASRAWKKGDGRLPLDFALISRQNELGGLGAYLTSLRSYRLVFPGTLRVTPEASGILEAFWTEPGERDSTQQYEEYALSALDPSATTIARSHGRLTLAGVGKRSRLSCLVANARSAQQDRLWEALFLRARDDSTLPLTHALIAAHRDGVDDAEVFLDGALRGRWQAVPDSVQAKAEVALAFGRMSRVLLACFNAAYGYVAEHQWIYDANEVAEHVFTDARLADLRAACDGVLTTKEHLRFSRLQFHGPDFLQLLRRLTHSSRGDTLEHLLHYHRAVQRTRRGGGGWIRHERDKLVMQQAGYNGYKVETRFPDLKLGVVRRLLEDLGRLR